MSSTGQRCPPSDARNAPAPLRGRVVCFRRRSLGARALKAPLHKPLNIGERLGRGSSRSSGWPASHRALSPRSHQVDAAPSPGWSLGAVEQVLVAVAAQVLEVVRGCLTKLASSSSASSIWWPF